VKKRQEEWSSRVRHALKIKTFRDLSSRSENLKNGDAPGEKAEEGR
jgi:hypothetical protein